MRKLLSKTTAKGSGVSAKKVAHESAVKHVNGKAQYLDDMPEWPGQLHVATGGSARAHAHVRSMDLSAVKSAPGVVDVIVQADIPGNPDIAAVFTGDPLLAAGEVEYMAQPLFAVLATSLEHAKRAVGLAKIDYEDLPTNLSPQHSLTDESFVLPTRELSMGDPEDAIVKSPCTLASEVYVRGQEHFYLEGQISIAVPTEDGGVHIYSSSQHPTEVQKLVAQVLNISIHCVQVEIRRMGGGFGGKETQAASLACLAGIFAVRNQKAVKYRMPRQDDMVQTGKRHDFWNRYRVGFDQEGVIQGVNIQLAGMCGFSADLSDGVVDRAMFHADNGYYLNNASITGYRCKTNTVSNTAFRGFGGPKGIITAELMMDDIARAVNKDPLDVRKANLYRQGYDETPYGQKIEQHVLPRLIEQLEDSADYRKRRAEITAYNQESRWVKKGIALTPVKFGISFTVSHLNQAGALIHIYTDGSVHVNHGGTEMGQGLHTKVAQVVARGFGISLERIMVSATRTDKVPNTSPTAASAGTDLNGMAALDAVNTIKQRLLEFAASHYQAPIETIRIAEDALWVGEQTVDFASFIQMAYMHRISLSANGFYRTPKIHYDRETGKGRPFLYYANGAAVSEVKVDVLTGEYKVTRVDILHDVGDSLNPRIDIGQIEGGFIQGMGWLTTEELMWDAQGKIMSNGPANYKIPTAADVPEVFNVNLYDEPNTEESVYRSKAVGEPPIMLAISVWCALRDACSSLCNYRYSPPLNAPATPEQVYFCLQAAKAWQADHMEEVSAHDQ